ncbi:hypothetical protein M1B35_10815 [Pseudomonas sp. MAFF 302046]|uniref:Rap1a immunity protein domain-containing protein n=1 Tax=Pseudomonas morbosilactucae TaxID=2938197 RepID=A0ABT0JFJ0_9PSED|nr:Rap1a/Tai family immunity protein [Pseudomonas morbosilactucae]MCK9814602.1 hypothetical protein [Pseudomonas morbosilactucae]
MKRILVAALLSLTSLTAFADGESLLKKCSLVSEPRPVAKTTNAEFILIGQCLGMVEGVGNTIAVLGEALPEARLCFPKAYTTKDGVRVVVAFLKNNPKDWSDSDTGMVMIALATEYGCG